MCKFFEKRTKEFYRHWECRQKLEISEEIFDYFLGLFPPKYMNGNKFGFAEGEEIITDFWTENGKYFLKQRLAENQRINENGNLVEHYFDPDCDRYIFDFSLCSGDDGWLQFDTEEDAWYFGIWVHKEKMKITKYLEGDIYIIKCLKETFNAEIKNLCNFYQEGKIATVIDFDEANITEIQQDRNQFFI